MIAQTTSHLTPADSMPDATSAPTPLVATGLTHRYRQRRGLSLGPLDLEINQPGITGLVGPNGAGKSTLLKIWAGLERPLAGSASVGGVDPWRDRPRAARFIGYGPQVPALYGALTVEQHLAFSRLERPGFDVETGRAYLGEMRVPLTAKGGELSGGQRAQVTLALALGTRAPTLLLDEPLASLDPLVRRGFLALLSQVVEERSSIAVLSSHVVTDIEQACSRLVVLGQGQVLVQGRITDLAATHRRIGAESPAPAGWQVISDFSSRDGKSTLIRSAGSPGSAVDGPGSTPASVEDIVVGYLTLGRARE